MEARKCEFAGGVVRPEVSVQCSVVFARVWAGTKERKSIHLPHHDVTYSISSALTLIAASVTRLILVIESLRRCNPSVYGRTLHCGKDNKKTVSPTSYSGLSSTSTYEPPPPQSLPHSGRPYPPPSIDLHALIGWMVDREEASCAEREVQRKEDAACFEALLSRLASLQLPTPLTEASTPGGSEAPGTGSLGPQSGCSASASSLL